MHMVNHAVARQQQRGMSDAVLDFILNNFDEDVDVGGGRRAWRISKRLARSLLASKTAQKSLVEGARNAAVVVQIEPVVKIITIVKGSGQQFKAYTRLRKGRGSKFR